MRPGIGLAWRPETAWYLQQREDLVLTEVVAENIRPAAVAPSLLKLRDRGTAIVVHGVSLGLGDATRPDRARLRHLAACATALGSPLISEHVAFVRGGGREVGHLLPVPRTRSMLKILVENVRIAQDALPVPLALENIAAPLGWPEDELTEADFLAELVAATGAQLLLDVANLYANHVNRDVDARAFLRRLPLDRVAYVHVAGGTRCDGWFHDTHAHTVGPGALSLLTEAIALGLTAPALLERDRDYPTHEALDAELAAIARAREVAVAA